MSLTPPAAGSINIIVACDEQRGIGLNGRLPFRIKEDWNWFMGHTRGGANVIGRISYQAMLRGGHVDGDRQFFVVSSDDSLAGEWTQVFADTQSAVDAAAKSGLPVWICGGTRIYEETLPQAHRLYLTQVHCSVECDAWMPDWRDHFQREVYRRDSSDARYSYSFIVLER